MAAWQNSPAELPRLAFSSYCSTLFTVMSGTPLVAPIFPAGREPLPPGMTEADRPQLEQAKQYQNYAVVAMESCVVKTGIAGIGGVLL